MTKRSSHSSYRAQAGTSFPNHDLLMTVAVVFIALAVGVPLWRTHGGKGCLLAFLVVAGGIAALIGLVALCLWVAENVNRAGQAPADKAWQGVGHLLRFAVGGFLGMIIAAPILVPKRLGPLWENLGLGVGIAMMGGISVWCFIRMGAGRYRRLGKAFLGTLLVSWALGLLSLLVSWPYALDVAILAPLLLFAVLVFFRKHDSGISGGTSSRPS